MAFAIGKANAQPSPVKDANQESKKSISLSGTKWEWEDKYEWDEEWGENESEYYDVSVYIEFITEQELYYESDWGPYGGNAENYYYSFDGNNGVIYNEEKPVFIVKTNEKGLPSTLILEGKNTGKLTLRRVEQ